MFCFYVEIKTLLKLNLQGFTFDRRRRRRRLELLLEDPLRLLLLLLVVMVEMLLIVVTSLSHHDRRPCRIVVMIVRGRLADSAAALQNLPHDRRRAGSRRRVQHVSPDLVLQDEHLLHFLRTVRFGYTEHGLFSLDVRLSRRVVDDLVLDDLGGVTLEDLHLHGLVGDHQVAHRVLVVLALLLLRLLLGLLLLLQLVLLLRLLLRLLLGLLLGLLLLLLDERLLVGLLDHNELLSLLGLGLLLRGCAATAAALVLLQMLALVQHQVVLLEERFAALADVRPDGAAAVRVASVVQQQTVLSGESFAAVAAVVGLGFGLGHDDGLLVLDLLLLLLDLLGLLLLLLLLDHLDLLLVGLLDLLVVLHLLLLGRTLRLDGLLNHLAGGGDYLYLVDGREQMAGDGRRERAQVRHQALVAGVQPQVQRQRFATVEGTAALPARVLRPR